MNNCNSKLDIDFLVISQPYDKTSQVEFIKELSNIFGPSKIVYRLHPSESYEGNCIFLGKVNNVEIKGATNDVYSDISRSHRVIGWWSTALIESLAFGINPYIVRCKLTEEYFPTDIEIWINTPKDILYLENNTQNINEIDIEKYWSGNFESTVRSVFDKILNH